MNGPVPFSCSVAKLGVVAEAGVGATELFSSHHFLSMMNQPSHCAIRMGLGESSITSTVLSSTLTNLASGGTLDRKLEPVARTRCAEKMTSSAVNESPLWNLTFLRRWKRQWVGVSVSQLSARAGTIFRSLSRVTRPS